MKENVHKLVFIRLFWVWLSLSLLVGAMVVWLEIRQVDREVFEVINKKVTILPEQVDGIIDQNLPVLGDLQHRAFDLTDTHFVVVDIYNVRQQHVVIAVRDADTELLEMIEARHHLFPFDNKIHYERFFLGKRLFMQVLIPLYSSNNELGGYFEGIYRVDEATAERIELRVFQSVALAVLVILITSIVLYPVILRLNGRLIEYAHEVFKANLELLEVMGSAIAKRDSDTDVHNYRVTLYTLAIGEALKLDRDELRNLIVGAFLHDVGKIGVEDRILLKAGKLNDQEMALMRAHVMIGIDIVKKASWLSGATDVIRFHHEHFDGKGYNDGLSGDAIPLNARVFAIADVFDALTSTRPYKEAYDLDSALKIMKEGRGKQFDPKLLDLFFDIAEELYEKIGKAKYTTLSRRLSVVVQRYFFEEKIK